MVNESNFEKYLISLGILKDIKEDKVRCRFCGTKITLKNLQVVFPYEKKVCAVCSRLKCLEKL